MGQDGNPEERNPAAGSSLPVLPSSGSRGRQQFLGVNTCMLENGGREASWRCHSARAPGRGVEPATVSLRAPGARHSSALVRLETDPQPSLLTLGAAQRRAQSFYLAISLPEKSLQSSCLNSNFMPNFKGLWGLLRRAQQALRASVHASKHLFMVMSVGHQERVKLG